MEAWTDVKCSEGASHGAVRKEYEQRPNLGGITPDAPLRRELLHRDLKNDEKGTAMPNQKECRSTTENSMCEDSLWRKSYQRSS